jgi:hypothetical protein
MKKAVGIYSFFIALVLLALEAFNFSTTKFALGDLWEMWALALLPGLPFWLLPFAEWI